jgi:hypothetical protein
MSSPNADSRGPLRGAAGEKGPSDVFAQRGERVLIYGAAAKSPWGGCLPNSPEAISTIHNVCSRGRRGRQWRASVPAAMPRKGEQWRVAASFHAVGHHHALPSSTTVLSICRAGGKNAVVTHSQGPAKCFRSL